MVVSQRIPLLTVLLVVDGVMFVYFGLMALQDRTDEAEIWIVDAGIAVVALALFMVALLSLLKERRAADR